MDNGASSYRRFLEGDDNGIVEIIRDYKGLVTSYFASITVLCVLPQRKED